MTSQLVPSELIAHAARIMCARRYDTFLKTYQSVDQLEYRSRRIGSLHGPVEHGLVWVRYDVTVVFSDVCQHIHIDAGA